MQRATTIVVHIVKSHSHLICCELTHCSNDLRLGLLIWNVEILLQIAMPKMIISVWSVVRRSNLELPDSVVDPSHHFLCDDWNAEMRQTMTYFTSSCHRRVGGSHVQVKLNVHGDENLSPLLLALTVVGFDSVPNFVTN